MCISPKPCDVVLQKDSVIYTYNIDNLIYFPSFTYCQNADECQVSNSKCSLNSRLINPNIYKTSTIGYIIDFSNTTFPKFNSYFLSNLFPHNLPTYLRNTHLQCSIIISGIILLFSYFPLHSSFNLSKILLLLSFKYAHHCLHWIVLSSTSYTHNISQNPLPLTFRVKLALKKFFGGKSKALAIALWGYDC